jgi:hypothetical protein
VPDPKKPGQMKDDEIDKTFCRLHWFMTDPLVAAPLSYEQLYMKATPEQLRTWFNLFAFTN